MTGRSQQVTVPTCGTHVTHLAVYDYSRMHELPYGNHGDHTSRRLLPVLPLREPGLLSRGQ